MLTLGVVAPATRGGLAIKNGSVTLVEDSRILLSVSEERLTRVKHAPGSCRAAHVAIAHHLGASRVNYLVTSSCCEAPEVAGVDIGLPAEVLDLPVLRSPSHHFSHALMAYLLSPFDRALIVIVDAGGSTLTSARSDMEWWTAEREQITVYLAEAATMEVVHRGFREPNSWGVGECYRAFTKFLGLGGQTEAGKTMGLAAYGDARRINGSLFESADDGVTLRSRLLLRDPDDAEAAVSRFLEGCGLHLRPRAHQDPLRGVHADLAAFVQSETENALVRLVAELAQRHRVSNVCLAGGVFLNCPTNSRIASLTGVDSVFVPPCPGDDGQSVGNALLPLWRSSRKKPAVSLPSAFLGPRQSGRVDLRALLSQVRSPVEVCEDSEDFKVAAQLLSEGAILGWFHGRSEVGPRALGNRSILGDPRKTGTRERLSHQIKGRDPFRPYAASVLATEAERWFLLPCPNPFMLFLGQMRQRTREIAPALFHPDGTCRVQTVGGEVPELCALLGAFLARTGVPFLVNTSLNGPVEPIVESASEALECFDRSGLDAMAIGRTLVRRIHAPANLSTGRTSHAVYGSDPDFIQRLAMEFPGMPRRPRRAFRFLPEFWNWIRFGTKTTTVRYSPGAIDVPESRTLPAITGLDEQSAHRLSIREYRVVSFSQLTEADAVCDGFRSREELRTTLLQLYGPIPEWHPVTIYEVDMESATTSSGPAVAGPLS